MHLQKVLKSHEGWVWDACCDAENDFFASAGADQTIRVWGLASGELKLILTGHRMSVRSLAISQQMPYMFSGSEDKEVFCWDLEHNKVTRTYHGHRSGVYSVCLHPDIPYLLATGSRDASVRVWDVRTRTAIHVLNHDGPINSVLMQGDEPQLVSASQDQTVKLWDLAAGKCRKTLTVHSNSVRSIALHPTEYTFVSGGKDAVMQHRFPNGEVLGEVMGKNDGVYTLNYLDDHLYVGGESGRVEIFENSSGKLIESVDAKSPILGSTFDYSGTRYITTHIDGSVKIWITSS